MAPRYGAGLRHVLALLGDIWQALVETAPDILEALHNLEEAVKEAFPLDCTGSGRVPLKNSMILRRLRS